MCGLLDSCRDPLAKDLLPCANCGAKPEFDCKIHVSHGNYDFDYMQSASARCVRCGYEVAVKTRTPVIIRQLWNLRINR